MTFEELQEKANRRFGRKLSDREIAEVAIENLNDANEKYEALEGYCDSQQETLTKLRETLAEQGRLSELTKAVSARIDEILSIPADDYEIIVTVGKTIVPTIDFTIKGNPIRYEEEDYE